MLASNTKPKRRRRWRVIPFLVLSLGLGGCLSSLLPAGVTGEPTLSTDQPAVTQDRQRKLTDRPFGDTGPVRGRETSPSKEDRNEVVFGSGLFASGKTGASKAVASDGEFSLNFAEANVREVAQTVLGDMLGQNFVVDSTIDQRITLRTNRPLARNALLPTLETTLAASGLAIIKDGDVYRVLPAAKAKGSSGRVVSVSGTDRLQPGYGVTIVALEHLAPSQMAKILDPMAPERSILRVDDGRNLLFLSATGPETKNLLETIEIFDVSALKSMSFGYFKLKNAKTTEITSELNSLTRAYQAQSGFNPPQVIPIDRLNAVLVFSSQAATLKLFQNWISRLDKEKSDGEARVYIYRVKNRKAKELAGLVASLFQRGSDTALNRGVDTPPDSKTTDLTTANADVTRTASFQRQDSVRQDTLRIDGRGGQDMRVIADLDNNSLVIKASADEYKSILSALSRLDVVPPLVMVEVTIAEVVLNDQLKFGVEWFFKKKQQDATFSGIDTGRILSKFPGFSYFFNAADVQVVVNAVSDVTSVKIVSSPKVMVMDNKTATLQIGDQVPIITGTTQAVTSVDAPVIQTVKYYDTGVILKVTPQVNAGGLISMDINQEVSNVAPDSSQGVNSPTIQQRKISSTIAIQSGQAVVLGGLIRDQKAVSNTGVPLLSQLPSVGDIFKSSGTKSDRTELIVIISPKVIMDQSDAREATDEIRSKMRGFNSGGNFKR